MDVEADTSTTRYPTHHPDLFRHRRFETPVGGRAGGGKIRSKTATWEMRNTFLRGHGAAKLYDFGELSGFYAMACHSHQR